jgi:PIN domain nuclease of toxin-antitoxin system
MTFVLDASAVLTLIQDEPGGQRVRSVVRQAVLSSVNLTEVVTKLTARGVPVNEIGEILQGIELFVHAHDEELAVDAGAMHAITRRHGLSLGDRACLALAQRLAATALTTDRAWSRVDVGVAIEVIR